MNLSFLPGSVSGVLPAPPSKSCAHRLLLCAALACGESLLENVAPSDDVRATADCLRALRAAITPEPCPSARIVVDGAPTSRSPASLRASAHTGAAIRSPNLRCRITGFDPFAAPAATLPCGESGSTLRLLLPLALLSGREMTFTGSKRLFERPLSVYETLCRERGLRFAQGETSLTVCGPLRPGSFTVPGGVSSQFASGLLFALPLLDGDSTLRLTPPLVSRPYLELTLASLEKFGIFVNKKADDLYEIPGNQHYSAKNAAVEGDWSNAAVFFALHALGHDVRVEGLDPDSLQGDRRCPALLDALRQGFASLDLTDVPDLGPVLFVAAALLHGGRFTGVRRLHDKESDRLAAMQAELAKLGAALQLDGDDAATVPPAALHAPTVPLCAHNDHRIAMALTIPLLKTGGTLAGAEAVAKSWPEFYEVLRSLGASLRRNDPAP